MSRTYPVTFYNLDNNRDPEQVEQEIRALLTGPKPAILGLCEAVGYDLPGVEGWRVIRDKSRPGRENLAAYVKNNLELSAVKWHDCYEQWTRPKDPPNQHWPRSILEFRAARLFVMVAHQPPQGTDNVKASQQEGIDKLSMRMAPWLRDDWEDRTEQDQAEAKAQARLVLWDANRKPGVNGPGPDMLCHNVDGWNCGAQIDLATWRGGEVEGAQAPQYFNQVKGVKLRSDHGHAFTCKLVLEDA